jgi:hypothetical protein
MTSEHPEAIRSKRRRALVSGRDTTVPGGWLWKGTEDPEKKLRRLEVEVKDLRAKGKRLQADLDRAEDLRDSVFHLAVSDYAPVRWPALKPGKARDRLHKPILFTSDGQYGEVVRADEMDGMNQFNKAIYAERYVRMLDKTIKWADAIAEGWGAKYDEGMIYLRGGDAISGEIHDELRETNDASVRGALLELAALESAGIRRLKDRFGHVHVISIPGNHGRITVKPRHKSYVNLNFETILADLIHAKFEREPGITFETPASGFAYFEACGWSFEMRHGDRMGAGGGTGFIGAPAPITKGHLRTRMAAAMVGKKVDYVLTGHLHTSMKLPRGFANGSMPGYNEYARSFNLDPDAAKQWLIFASPRHVYGVELELSDFPRIGAIT